MNDQEQLKVVDSILGVLNVMNTIIQEGNSNWDRFLAAQMKSLHTTVDQMRPVEIKAYMVLELRAATGEGLVACKNALVKARGDMDKARDYLR